MSVPSSKSSMDEIRIWTWPMIEEHGKLKYAYRGQVLPLPPYRPPRSLSQIPPLPVEILTFILFFLPGTSLPVLALFSLRHRPCYTANSICGMFGISTRCGYSLSRGEISPLSCTLSTSPRSLPHRLARMHNLLSLTLPSLDIHILHLHSASALHIEFVKTRLSEQAKAELPT